MSNDTPRKGCVRTLDYNLHMCVACAAFTKNARNLLHEASSLKKLAHLLAKFGGITIAEGYLCCKCERHIVKVEIDINFFYDMCQKNKYNLKRVAKDNLSIDDAGYEDSVPKLKASNISEDLIAEGHSSKDYEEHRTQKIKKGNSSKEAKKNLSSVFENESTCGDHSYTKKKKNLQQNQALKLILFQVVHQQGIITKSSRMTK